MLPLFSFPLSPASLLDALSNMLSNILPVKKEERRGGVLMFCSGNSVLYEATDSVLESTGIDKLKNHRTSKCRQKLLLIPDPFFFYSDNRHCCREVEQSCIPNRSYFKGTPVCHLRKRGYGSVFPSWLLGFSIIPSCS